MGELKPQPGVKAFDKLQRRMKRLYRHKYHKAGEGGYRGLGGEFRISPAMAQKIVVEGYYPRSAEICYTLGIPAYGQGRICLFHGVVHARMCRTPKPVSERKPRPGGGRKPLNIVWSENTLDF